MMTTSSSVIKYLLFLFNIVFVVTGFVLLGIGATIKAVYHGYYIFLDDQYLSAPNLLIAVGVIILLVSFLGCCGAVKENHCMIVSYIALLVLIFILELSAGIAGYVCRDQAEEFLLQKLKKTMEKYDPNVPEDKPVTLLWDTIQRNFECCGTTKMEEWYQTGKNFTTFPLSCCPLPSGLGPFHCTEKSNPPPFTSGCVDKFGAFIKDEAAVIGGAGIAIALLQLIGILMACRLASAMRRATSELTPM